MQRAPASPAMALMNRRSPSSRPGFRPGSQVYHRGRWPRGRKAVIGKRLVEWWTPITDAPALARQVDEQEELVKAKKVGYLVPTGVTSDVSRIGLRFPLLDAQQRINYVGSIAFGPAIIFAGLQPAKRVESEA